jgi:hypothetical protein
MVLKRIFFLDTDGCDDEEANGIVYTEQTEVLTNTAPEEKVKVIFNQCSGFGLDPDSIRSMDPDPDPGR